MEFQSIGIEFSIARVPRGDGQLVTQFLQVSVQNAVRLSLVREQFLLLGLLFSLQNVRLLINSLEDRLCDFLLPPLTDHDRETLIKLLVRFSDFDSFRVLLVKRADIEGIGGVHFSPRRHQWWRVLLQVHQLPVQVPEKGMLFYLIRTTTRWMSQRKRTQESLTRVPDTPV